MTEKKKTLPRFKMLDAANNFIKALTLETTLNKNEVIEALIVMHMQNAISAPAYTYTHRVKMVNESIKDQKD
jgi:hypothetical protein